jgi:hypothetical protein
MVAGPVNCTVAPLRKTPVGPRMVGVTVLTLPTVFGKLRTVGWTVKAIGSVAVAPLGFIIVTL